MVLVSSGHPFSTDSIYGFGNCSTTILRIDFIVGRNGHQKPPYRAETRGQCEEMVLLEFIVAVSLASLLVAGLLVRWIMARDPGSPKMMEIADAIRQGAEAYLGRQYRTISIIAVIFAIVFAIVIREDRKSTRLN